MNKKNVGKSGVFIWIGCVFISLAVIYVFLITSFEIVAYGDMDYYQSEYEKYEVADTLDMGMEDIMYVTEEMMSYLRGDRDSLVIDTVVAGENRTFFNESEISHMEDVRELFIAGIHGRRWCVGMIAVLLVAFLLTKKRFTHILYRAFCYTTIGVAIVSGIVGYLFATNFYKYFEIFHKIFFEGDTWLFDPHTSLMINMLPEGLFYDMTLRIVIVFLLLMIVTLVGTFGARKNKKSK